MARKGDLIVVNPPRVGGPPREGEILEVIERGLRVQYRVRWKDGHESYFAPAAGSARIKPAPDRKKTGSQMTEPKKSPGKKSPGKKSTPTKTTAKTASAKTTATKKSTAKTAIKSAARKSTVRKVAAKRAAPRGPSGRR